MFSNSIRVMSMMLASLPYKREKNRTPFRYSHPADEMRKCSPSFRACSRLRRSLYGECWVKNALRAFFTQHSPSLTRRRSPSEVYGVENTHSAHFSHYTLPIPCAARSPSMYSVRNALRAFLTQHSPSRARQSRIPFLTNTGGARLLECMV